MAKTDNKSTAQTAQDAISAPPGDLLSNAQASQSVTADAPTVKPDEVAATAVSDVAGSVALDVSADEAKVEGFLSKIEADLKNYTGEARAAVHAALVALQGAVAKVERAAQHAEGEVKEFFADLHRFL